MPAIEQRVKSGQAVVAGTILAVLRMPTPSPDQAEPDSSDGSGPKVRPHAHPRSPKLTAGPHAALSPDGLTLTATAYGVVDSKGSGVVPCVEVSADEMLATIDVHPVAEGTLTVLGLTDAASKAGITFGLYAARLPEAIAQAVATQTAVLKVPVAHGRVAIRGHAGAITLHVADGQRVAEATLLATRGAPEPSVPACTVRGKESAAPEPSVEALEIDASVEHAENRYVARVAGFGYVEVRGNKISVASALRVSEDRLSARLCLRAAVGGSAVPSRKDIEALLRTQKITREPDWAAIDGLLRTIRESQTMAEGIAVHGIAPVDGEDGRLECVHADDHEDDDNIYYRNHTDLVDVTEGATVCRLIPATEGKPGVDIYGVPIEPRPGKAFKVDYGENVKPGASEEEITAAKDGVMMVRGNRVSVHDVFVVTGDAGVRTGNIRSGKSAVQIRGSVKTGFHVESKVHVAVKETVEDAIIESGGDVIVGGGVIQRSFGSIRAGGAFCATFADRARIEAVADITLKNEALRSTLQTLGRVVISGAHGQLVGGTTIARGGVDVKRLGCSAGTETRVIVGSSPDFVLIAEKIQAVEKEIAEIDKELPPSVTPEDVAKMPLAKRKHAQEKLAARQRATAELPGLFEQRKQWLANTCSADVGVTVRETVYPGVVLTIYGAHLEVTEPASRCRYAFNPETGRIEVGPIR